MMFCPQSWKSPPVYLPEGTKTLLRCFHELQKEKEKEQELELFYNCIKEAIEQNVLQFKIIDIKCQEKMDSSTIDLIKSLLTINHDYDFIYQMLEIETPIVIKSPLHKVALGFRTTSLGFRTTQYDYKNSKSFFCSRINQCLKRIENYVVKSIDTDYKVENEVLDIYIIHR